jgi:hypothetical protein
LRNALDLHHLPKLSGIRRLDAPKGLDAGCSEM